MPANFQAMPSRLKRLGQVQVLSCLIKSFVLANPKSWTHTEPFVSHCSSDHQTTGIRTGWPAVNGLPSNWQKYRKQQILQLIITFRNCPPKLHPARQVTNISTIWGAQWQAIQFHAKGGYQMRIRRQQMMEPRKDILDLVQAVRSSFYKLMWQLVILHWDGDQSK